MKKRTVIVVLFAIIIIALTSACGNEDNNHKTERGFDITGTWIAKTDDGKYELEITIDSVDYTERHESISANAILKHETIGTWGKPEVQTLHFSSKDFNVQYKLFSGSHGDVYDCTTVSFSYGKAISEYITLTFYSTGEAKFETPVDIICPLTRK